MSNLIFHDWESAQNNGAFLDTDKTTGLEVLHIRKLASLFQAIGYAKWKKRDEFLVYYRGQTQLFAGADEEGNYWFQPSALRNARKSKDICQVKAKMKDCVAAIRTLDGDFKDSEQYPDSVIEALLQQYGMTSTWIDVVDNIWIALWFACHQADSTVSFAVRETPKADFLTPRRSFIHMIRRSPRKEDLSQRYAYILLLAGEEILPKDDTEGTIPKDNTEEIIPKDDRAKKRKKYTEMLDLRTKLPSSFIRPHVQHGLLVRSKSFNNMVPLIQGIIRIDLEDALEWLGEGRILLPESIFPPPNYDAGFKWLLENERKIMDACESCFPIYC